MLLPTHLAMSGWWWLNRSEEYTTVSKLTESGTGRGQCQASSLVVVGQVGHAGVIAGRVFCRPVWIRDPGHPVRLSLRCFGCISAAFTMAGVIRMAWSCARTNSGGASRFSASQNL